MKLDRPFVGLFLCHRLVRQPRLLCRNYSTRNSSIEDVPSTSANDLTQKLTSFRSDPEKIIKVKVRNGLPMLKVPLPSRAEKCLFILRPISDTVGSFCQKLRDEDKGIEIAAIYKMDGTRVSKSVPIESLMIFPIFRIRINDQIFDVETQSSATSSDMELLKSSDTLKGMDDVKATVAALYTVLNIDGFKLEREKKLMVALEEIQLKLEPLEKIRIQLEQECEHYSNQVLWGGLITMGIQTGIFARLTWIDYSWDIVEPCTYFATFSTVIATFGYYIYTKQSFEYDSAQQRVFTQQFHKRAKKAKFDIKEYNQLKSLEHEIKEDLRRLRDPLQQHLPAHRLASLELDAAKWRLSKQS
ncbi:unnamed protein product [Bursaphelenchus xylophilus]|uniref:Calcium uniporter protein n=1 Tax=Bursaphelenchus xylophilus TaxID=6326 RepID=A0A1I7SW41_BURXY|nr:unnamed protein product [Bursaphelenchus xylophilus]CAG9098774.1 unnamed protein product [Bursaphelenchus xylophilus]